MSKELEKREDRATMTPQTFSEAQKFAEMVSTTEFAPKSYRGKPEACLLAIVAGSEVGLKPMQSLQNIAVINGVPSIFGDAALALVKDSPDYEYLIESMEGDKAVCRAKRRGEEEIIREFSWGDAERAELTTKSGPWKQYPKRMLQMRARSWAIRDCWPHVLKGFSVAEEARDIPQEPRDVTESPERETGPSELRPSQREQFEERLNQAVGDNLISEEDRKETLVRYDRAKSGQVAAKYKERVLEKIEALRIEPQAAEGENQEELDIY